MVQFVRKTAHKKHAAKPSIAGGGYTGAFIGGSGSRVIQAPCNPSGGGNVDQLGDTDNDGDGLGGGTDAGAGQ